MTVPTHTALIVEDDPRTAADLARFVRSLGHEARIATTLVEVDQAIAEGRSAKSVWSIAEF
jgi:DNA-binding response OmpR family regulator